MRRRPRRHAQSRRSASVMVTRNARACPFAMKYPSTVDPHPPMPLRQAQGHGPLPLPLCGRGAFNDPFYDKLWSGEGLADYLEGTLRPGASPALDDRREELVILDLSHPALGEFRRPAQA